MVKQSKATTDASSEEFLCVFTGGLLKQNTVTVVTSTNPTETYAELKELYGTQLKGAFTASTNAKKQYEDLKSKHLESYHTGTLFRFAFKTMCSEVLSLTDSKKMSLLKPKKEDGKSGSDTDVKSKKGAKSEDETKGKKKGGKGKKEPAAAAAPEDKKPKGKKVKDEKSAPKGKGKKVKDESDVSDTDSVASSKSSVSSKSSSSSSSEESVKSIPSVKKGKGKDRKAK